MIGKRVVKWIGLLCGVLSFSITDPITEYNTNTQIIKKILGFKNTEFEIFLKTGAYSKQQLKIKTLESMSNQNSIFGSLLTIPYQRVLHAAF